MKTLTATLLLALASIALGQGMCPPGVPVGPGCYSVCICDQYGQNCHTVVVCK